MDNQIPFVYSFSKYNFLLKEAYIHEICMMPPKVGRGRERKQTQRHCVAEKHRQQLHPSDSVFNLGNEKWGKRLLMSRVNDDLILQLLSFPVLS